MLIFQIYRAKLVSTHGSKSFLYCGAPLGLFLLVSIGLLIRSYNIRPGIGVVPDFDLFFICDGQGARPSSGRLGQLRRSVSSLWTRFR